MKATISLLLLALLLALPARTHAAPRGKAHLAIERGQVLFLVDRNRWEPAPNYLRLREGDTLKVMPGTVGRVRLPDGSEYTLPVAETVTIEADGISWRRDGGIVRTRFVDGYYHSVVDADDGREFPAAVMPRAIEIVPSEQRLAARAKAADESCARLRDRLLRARLTVLEERRVIPPTRFRPDEMDAVRGDPERIAPPSERMADTLVATVDGSDRHAAWRRVETARASLDRLDTAASALERKIEQDRLANLDTSADAARLAAMNRLSRERGERLRRLAKRERLLRTIE